MTSRLSVPALLVCAASLLLISTAPAGAGTDTDTDKDPTWEGGLFFSYLRGDYGQDRTTDIYYGALMVKRFFSKGDVTLTVPGLYIPSAGVTFIDGTTQTDSTATGGAGLGDVILKGRYYAIDQDGLIPFVDLVGSVKFPTADADKGLGTGEPDFTLLSEFTWRLGASPWTALAEFGYTFVGEPAGLDVENRWLYSVGMAYEVDPKLTLSGYLDGRTAIFEGDENPLSVLLVSQYKIQPGLCWDTLLEFGLTDGAPDIGITLGLRKRI